MRKSIIILFCLLTAFIVHSQNGVYQSSIFEYINENNPSKNHREPADNTLIIQINELQGEFIDGKILWEMKKDGKSEYMEWELIRIKNSFFDEETNSFVKSYKANMKILGVVMRQADVYITKNIKDNTYRIDVYDPELKVINRFDNVTKK